jgi:hypothetical protein
MLAPVVTGYPRVFAGTLIAGLSRVREAANKYNLIDGVNVCISPHHPHPSRHVPRTTSCLPRMRARPITGKFNVGVLEFFGDRLLRHRLSYSGQRASPPPQYLISLRRSVPPDTILSRTLWRGTFPLSAIARMVASASMIEGEVETAKA